MLWAMRLNKWKSSAPCAMISGGCLKPTPLDVWIRFDRIEFEHRSDDMNSGSTPRWIALVFVAALAFYFAGFYGLEYLRVRKGAWKVAFEPNPGGDPVLRITQPSVGVIDMKLIFHGERATNQPATVHFDTVQKNALFGDVIYEDLTFLPGVVTFNLFGHEIELVPRVLVVNKHEIAWQSGGVV